MSVSVRLSVCVSVCVCLTAIIYLRSYLWNYTSDFYHFFVRVTYGRGSVLLWRRNDTLCTFFFLWMTSYLLISQGCSRRRRPAEAQNTRSPGLGYKLCAVVPVAG